MTSRNPSIAVRVQRRDRSRAASAYLGIGLGLLSLLSALLRPLHSWLHGPLAMLPEFLIQVSAIYVVFGSFGLFVLARYLRSGNRVAWAGSVLLLALIAVLHAGKRADWPLAALCAAAALWLGLQYRAFPVWPGRLALKRALLVAGAALALASLLVGALVLRLALATDQDLGSGARQFAAVLDAELHEHHLTLSFALVAAVLLGLAGLLWWYQYTGSHTAPADAAAHLADRERAREIVARHGGGTLDYFALRDDKRWFFLGQSVIAYAVRGSVCLVSPDPIGPAAERGETWAEFMVFAEQRGWSVSVLGAAENWLETYERSGLRTVYLGDEAIVDSASFSLAGKKSKSLRQSHARLLRAGYRVEHVDPLRLDPAVRARLADLAGESRRGEAERGFSMTLSRLFDPADTGLLLSIAYDGAGTPQAFIQWVPAAALRGWSLDVMRRSTSGQLPGGLMDFLIIEMLGKLADEGGGELGLNFAVLREAVAGGEQAAVGWFERLVAKQASKHAQVESLYRFNTKYDPRWQPRYAAVGTVDLWLSQGLRMAQAEGLAELPALPRLRPERA